MSKLVAQFDPSTGSGMFAAGAVNRCSTLWVMNESPNFLQFDFGGAGPVKVIQPWYNKRISLRQPVNQVSWTVQATLQAGSSPASVVFVELYEPTEDISDLLSGSIFRQTNVGNAAAVSASASAVQNDGNAAGTTILEGTPSGAGASQALITNDGRATLGGGNLKIDATGKFTALPAGAVPVASIAGGALPSGVTLPAGQVTGTLPAAQVGSGYPAVNVNNPPWVNKTGDTMSSALTVARATAGGAVNFFILDATDKNTYNVGIDGPTGDFFIYDATSGQFVLRVGQNGGVTTNGAALIGLSSGGSLSGVNPISGSGSATVNHGLSATPDAAVVNNAAGTNSSTLGSGSYTSSTVFIYQFSAMAWKGLVYKA